MTVEEWENEVNYGEHRICRHCGNVTIKAMMSGYRYECYLKKVAIGSGSVKPTYSCIQWNPAIAREFMESGAKLVNAMELLKEAHNETKG
jgi:hypothetical protein